jgi:hypothetical protein
MDGLEGSNKPLRMTNPTLSVFENYYENLLSRKLPDGKLLMR